MQLQNQKPESEFMYQPPKNDLFIHIYKSLKLLFDFLRDKFK